MNREAARAHDSIDWARVREDFPVLKRQVHGKPLVYLDSANTGQKPAVVIDTVDDFFRNHNANVSRAVHALGSEATEAYEGARTLRNRATRSWSPGWSTTPTSCRGNSSRSAPAR